MYMTKTHRLLVYNRPALKMSCRYFGFFFYVLSHRGKKMGQGILYQVPCCGVFILYQQVPYFGPRARVFYASIYLFLALGSGYFIHGTFFRPSRLGIFYQVPSFGPQVRVFHTSRYLNLALGLGYFISAYAVPYFGPRVRVFYTRYLFLALDQGIYLCQHLPYFGPRVR